MKKSLLFLPFLLLLVGAFISCEEVEEAGKYDNWRERGEAFVDSIKRLTLIPQHFDLTLFISS